jgi:hypothetical protein
VSKAGVEHRHLRENSCVDDPESSKDNFAKEGTLMKRM